MAAWGAEVAAADPAGRRRFAATWRVRNLRRRRRRASTPSSRAVVPDLAGDRGLRVPARGPERCGVARPAQAVASCHGLDRHRADGNRFDRPGPGHRRARARRGRRAVARACTPTSRSPAASVEHPRPPRGSMSVDGRPRAGGDGRAVHGARRSGGGRRGRTAWPRWPGGGAEEGGNALDAVVAMALAESVLLPPKCGLGGDLIAIAFPGVGAEPDALLAVGGAAGRPGRVAQRPALARRRARRRSARRRPPAGYLALAAAGRLAARAPRRPGVALAVDGLPWAAVCTAVADGRRTRRRDEPRGLRLLPGRRAHRAGHDRAPARSGRRARASGSARGAALLDGPVACDRHRGRGGGARRRADGGGLRARHRPSGWRAPPGADGRPAGCGHARSDARPVAAGRGRRSHRPATIRAPASTGAVMAAIARPRRALGDPSGTSMVSGRRRSGNVVVVVHSNSFPRFGSGIVVPEYDLVLANRAGRGFTPIPGHPNFPAAGRRPATTLHAWAVADASGRPRLAGATPGGANQMPWNAQLLGQVVGGCWEARRARDRAAMGVAPAGRRRAHGGRLLRGGPGRPASGRTAGHFGGPLGPEVGPTGRAGPSRRRGLRRRGRPSHRGRRHRLLTSRHRPSEHAASPRRPRSWPIWSCCVRCGRP